MAYETDVGPTGTDIFDQPFHQFAGVVDATKAEITFTYDATDYYLGVTGLTMGYKDAMQQMRLLGNRSIVWTKGATGQVGIQSLMGTSIPTFLSTFGDITTMASSTPLSIKVLENAMATAPNGETWPVDPGTSIDCYGVHSVNWQGKNQGKPIVMSSVSLFVMNMEWA